MVARHSMDFLPDHDRRSGYWSRHCIRNRNFHITNIPSHAQYQQCKANTNRSTLFILNLVTYFLYFFLSLSLSLISLEKSAGGAGGAASVIIQGLSVGMYSAVIPSIVVAAALIFSSAFGGVYGVALASTGLLSCLAFTMSTDAFGAIADNAGGIAEMCNLPEEVRERTDILDGMGNTTAAIGKGFAIGAALLTGISLTNLFGIRVGLSNLDVIADPYATAGVLIGAVCCHTPCSRCTAPPLLFSQLCIYFCTHHSYDSLTLPITDDALLFQCHDHGRSQ